MERKESFIPKKMKKRALAPSDAPSSSRAPNDAPSDAPARKKQKRRRHKHKAADASSAPVASGERFTCRSGAVDLAEGLVLHRDAVTEAEERELVAFVRAQCDAGRRGELRKPTYLRASGGRSRGNRREALQYGGFFDFNRARPGRPGLVPPFPPVLERLVARLVDGSRLLPADARPDSAIINYYDAGDCIPPHTDHASYARPISTLSLLGEEPMLVGSAFRCVRESTWEPVVGLAVPCPRRSLLVLGGNAGTVAKHCISACSGPRVSVTLRKQPPPDWRPDAADLARGRPAGAAEPAKKKALSGSAKRRKKEAKRRAASGG